MNFIKSGWSYLSSSFTQSEEDPDEQNTSLESSKITDDIIEEAVDTVENEAWGDSVDNNDEELIEFTDAIDSTDDQFRQTQLDVTQSYVDSPESVVESNEILEQQSHSVNDMTEGVTSADSSQNTNTINMDNSIESEAVGSEITTKAEGYTSLEASDSDDSGEFIPPPAAPVGPSVNTESQLNEIIKNLGGDLGILTLEEETQSDATNPGENTIGESLYLTAYDQTICPSAEETLFNSFSVTAVGADLNYNGETSPDSAIASSSKSSICSIDSVKLNFDSASDLPDKPLQITNAIDADQPLTPQITDGQFFTGLDDTPVDQAFSNSILDTTVKEVDNTEESSIENAVTHSSDNTDKEDKNIEAQDKESTIDVIPDIVSDTSTNTQNDHGNDKKDDKVPVSFEENKLEIQSSTSSQNNEKESSESKMDEEEIPIGRGAYTIDFDNLDDFNPFQSTKAVSNSPDVPDKPFPASIAMQNNLSVNDPKPNVEDVTAIESNHIEIEQEKPTSVSKIEKSVSDEPNQQPIINDVLPTQNEKIVQNEIVKPVENSIEELHSSKTEDKLQIDSKQDLQNEDLSKSNQEDEPIPISKGSYTLDLDNLDSLDPFKTSKGLQNSPTKPTSTYSFNLDNMEDADPFKSSKTLSFSPPKSPVKNNVGFLKHMNNNEEPSLPEPVKKTTVEDSKIANDLLIINDDVAGNLENVDPSPKKKPAKKPVLGANRKKVNRPMKKKEAPIKAPNPEPSPTDPEDEIILPKGSYSINFDDLDNFDPFKTSKGLCNSPTKTVSEPSFAPPPKVGEEGRPGTVEDSPGKGTPVDPPGLLTKKTDEPMHHEKEVEDKPEILEETKPVEIEKSPLKKPAKKVGGTPGKKKKKPPAAFKPPEPENNDEDEIPLPKGTYNLDFDNLEAMDPFKTSKGLTNSPTDKKSSIDFTNLDSIDPFKPSKAMQNSPPSSPKITVNDKKENQSEPVESNNDKVSEDKPIVESTADKAVEEEKKPEVKKPVKKKTGLARKKLIKPGLKKPPPPTEDETNTDEPPLPKGAYNLDFDNLDAMDPFKSSKGISNSPTKNVPTSGYPMNPDDLESIDPFKPKKTLMMNSPPRSPAETKPEPGVVEEPKKTPVSVQKKKKKVVTKVPEPHVEVDLDNAEPPLPKGAYNLDFDNLDAMDPFKSSKGIPNSPTKDVPSSGYAMNSDDLESIDSFKPKKTLMMNSPPNSPTKTEIEPEAIAETSEAEEKEESTQKEALTKVEESSAIIDSNAEPPLPKGAYNLDLDNLDAIDPFKSSKGISNSPTKDVPSSGYAMNSDDLESIDPFKPKKTLMMNSPPRSPAVENDKLNENTPDSENKMRDLTSVTSTDELDPAFQTANETVDISTTEKQNENNYVESMEITKENEVADYKKLQQMEFDKVNENEEFYPASAVFEDSASLDYLDQLSGSKPLTESDLRKQSLYVKFDPLVGNSPIKQIDQQMQKDSQLNVTRDITENNIDDKAIGDHIQVTEQQRVSHLPPAEKNSNEIITLAGTNEAVAPPFHVSSGLELHSVSMDSFNNQSYISQQSSASSIFKYTQADLDNVRRSAEQEWEKEKNEARKKEETMKAEAEQLTTVVKEYERLFAEINSNGKMTREQQLLKAEREQSLEDMAALERSHEDLCRRYNKLKAVVVQFKQNEDILKKSANEVMEEAKETEKKYISLKVKATEEIKKANAELQFVKMNAQQEVARAQAQLKMLELKCESLTSQIRDSKKENEELTKLCEDLFACSKQQE
ncbi:uncharacterized protein LOC120327155 isoform X1 [Styela clava]